LSECRFPAMGKGAAALPTHPALLSAAMTAAPGAQALACVPPNER